MGVSIKPIRTESDYQEALNQVSTLMDAKPGSSDFDALCILSDLIQLYEQKNFAIGFPEPLEAIKFELEQSGKTIEDLQAMLGKTVDVVELMSGRRKLTLRSIRALHHQLGIPYEILMQDDARVA